ncbi:hypothetical protein BH11CYA1_BH11CYA1_23640 [soil metagenome]
MSIKNLIIDQGVRDLVARIDISSDTQALDLLLSELVDRLTRNCQAEGVQERYRQYALPLQESSTSISSLSTLPVGSDGYVIGYDPLTQESEFFASWQKHGIVIGANLVNASLCQAVTARMHDLVLALSQGACDLADAKTWNSIPVDEAGVPILSRGFFEVYHDQAIAAIRQSVRVYIHYVLIWGRADLWVSYDRLGIKLPGHIEGKALPLHVDQNPNVHADFRTVQGVLALRDCPKERGTFVGVPGSKTYFAAYGAMAKNGGEYVELDLTQPHADELTLNAQVCPLRAGHLISWDSRTTHANSENFSNETRMVAYIAFGPQRQDDEAACAARSDGFNSGLGTNVRTALMHASKKPRYTSMARLAALRQVEHLTKLGRLIYGQERYL